MEADGGHFAIDPRTTSRSIVLLNYLAVLNLYNLWKRLKEKRRIRRKRRWYVRPINCSRPIRGEFNSLVNDFADLEDDERHRDYFRMDEGRMNMLLERVRPLLLHRSSHALPISPDFRLAFTIRLLASGDSIITAAQSYRIGYQTAHNIVYETCDALWTALQPEFLKFPTLDDWRRIAERYEERWNFPNCCGAIDGKHVVIRKPPEAGSSYFNYKLDHSIVLMAVCDADYHFTYVDIGQYGRCSDGGVFAHCTFGKALCGESPMDMNLPEAKFLPESRSLCPHIFVADDAFPIGPHIMKPYGGTKRTLEQRIFDYRLSRARNTIECSFGILSSRWRILYQPIRGNPANVVRIVKALIVLHNFLLTTDSQSPQDNQYAPPYMRDIENVETGEIRPGGWRQDVTNAALMELERCRNKSRVGLLVRDRFKVYFNSEGSVPWQRRRFQR